MLPFIYVYDGGACAKQIKRPEDIEMLGCLFIARGGRYVVTLWSDDVVQLQAVVPGEGVQPRTLVTKTVPNGPLMLGAIDRLVKESVKKMNLVQ